ncbi:hypothetical protein ANANG_G00029170 [Anguilla anguilla]|uniref:Uncharacterized protein n=1 Tax=Anguilla anguilla TaxID=7936 RepID=A0A9D3S3U5_ANGAN|nr:hypothetical protein ANANG_G00029170 [Anguilla anguilla]
MRVRGSLSVEGPSSSLFRSQRLIGRLRAHHAHTLPEWPCGTALLGGSMTSLESSHSGFSQLSAATTSPSQSQSSSMISR